MTTNGDIRLYRKFVETARLLTVYLNHFPKHEKYALCTRIKDCAYQVFDLLVEGQKRYHKKTTLTELDIAHEQLRMQLWLAFELGYFRFQDGKKADNAEELELHRWATITKLIDELGRMIGGWIRSEALSLKQKG